jgi:hypothetical protein
MLVINFISTLKLTSVTSLEPSTKKAISTRARKREKRKKVFKILFYRFNKVFFKPFFHEFSYNKTVSLNWMSCCILTKKVYFRDSHLNNTFRSNKKLIRQHGSKGKCKKRHLKIRCPKLAKNVFPIQDLLHHSIIYTFIHYRTIKMDALIIAFLRSYL